MSVYSAVLSIILLFAGCEAKRWRNNQFEGIWRIEANAAGSASTAPTLNLTHDGKFVAISVPTTFLGLDDAKSDQVLSGSGTWSVTQYDPRHDGRLQLTFTRVEGIEVYSLPWGTQLSIQGSDRDPHLFYFIGDPDDGRKVMLRRE